jgi:uncharacterized membrane protein
MNHSIAFMSLVSVAGFAGGCLCLSVTLSALLARPPADAALIMQVLLPRMGAIMAPLLGGGLLFGVYTAAIALRGSHAHAGSWVLAAVAFASIAIVTVSVHFPINAQLIAEGSLAGVRGGALLQRWLSWHHLRTVLAFVALAALIWPLRHALT